MDIPSFAPVTSPRPPRPGFLRLFALGGLLKAIDPDGVISTLFDSTARQYAEPYAGAPVNAVAASLSTNLANATNNDLVFTWRTKGTAGNNGTIQYAISGGGSAVISVAVAGTAILVTAGSATTAATVKTAVEADATANALVTVANKAANDGTGVIDTMAATPLTGGIDGTPAKLGRIATDGTDIWVARTEDPTVTQAGWVKILDA